MKKLLLCLLFLVSSPGAALAANCSAYPYTLTNGTTADANQVMADFNTILSCGNNNLLGVNNNLSDVQSASAARTNLGLGTAATKGVSDNGRQTVPTLGTTTNGYVVQFVDNNGTEADSGLVTTDVLTKSGNLAGLSSASTSRTNLGLGSIATANVTYSTSGPSGTANTNDLWLQYVP